MSGLRHFIDLAALAVVHPRCVAIALSAIRRPGAVQRTSELARALAHVGRLRPTVIVEIGSHRSGNSGTSCAGDRAPWNWWTCTAGSSAGWESVCYG